MDSEKERMRYGEWSPNRPGLLPRTNSEAKFGNQKKKPSKGRVRNYSEVCACVCVLCVLCLLCVYVCVFVFVFVFVCVRARACAF